MSEPVKTSFVSRLRNFILIGERLFLAGTILGCAFKYLNYPANDILFFSLVGLATVFFLGAFLPGDVSGPTENDTESKMGFVDLLMKTILPKVAGVGMAVAVIGILFGLMRMPGAVQMLLIGGTTCGLVTLLAGYGVVKGDSSGVFMSMLYKTVPLFVLCFYFIAQISPGFMGGI